MFSDIPAADPASETAICFRKILDAGTPLETIIYFLQPEDYQTLLATGPTVRQMCLKLCWRARYHAWFGLPPEFVHPLRVGCNKDRRVHSSPIFRAIRKGDRAEVTRLITQREVPLPRDHPKAEDPPNLPSSRLFGRMVELALRCRDLGMAKCLEALSGPRLWRGSRRRRCVHPRLVKAALCTGRPEILAWVKMSLCAEYEGMGMCLAAVHGCNSWMLGEVLDANKALVGDGSKSQMELTAYAVQRGWWQGVLAISRARTFGDLPIRVQATACRAAFRFTKHGILDRIKQALTPDETQRLATWTIATDFHSHTISSVVRLLDPTAAPFAWHPQRSPPNLRWCHARLKRHGIHIYRSSYFYHLIVWR